MTKQIKKTKLVIPKDFFLGRELSLYLDGKLLPVYDLKINSAPSDVVSVTATFKLDEIEVKDDPEDK